jgi:hypothetical protein
VNRVSANRFVYRLLLALLLLAGLGLRYAGLDESVQLHPDERNIATWMNRMRATGSLRPDTYAGGFFVLADAARAATEATVWNVGHRWAYFIGTADRPSARPLDPVVFGRHFNVWLGTLAILLAAGLARRLTGSRAAALVAAALMAFAAFSIEHAHYLESDLAMLAALLLALWALSRFLAARRIRDWILAAVLCGFAAGTKFPLASLLLPLVAAARAPRGHPRPFRRIGLLLALAAVAVPLGFVAATPDALDGPEFRAGLAKAGAAVFAETAEILGPAAGEPFARQHMNAANLVRFAGSLRPGWLVLAALGLPLCFARRFRAYWPVAVLFPAALLVQIVCLAPWSRSQEFLMLLPNLAVWAALPIGALWAARAPAQKAAAVVLAAVAVLPVAQTGVAVSSQFAWEDTRRLANRALAACFPPDQPLAAELYAAPAEAHLTPRVRPLAEYAIEANRFRKAPAAPDYLLLNVDFDTRGLCDPRTRAYFPPFAENWAALQTEGRQIAAWGALDSPAPQPYFRAPRIELWHRRAGTLPTPADLGVELPRPALVVDEGRTTFFRGDLPAGPRRALLIDRFEREIALGGPGDFDGPVFLVFTTHERAATIRLEGFGRTRRVELPPHDAVAVALERPWWRPRWARYERISVRAEPTDRTLTYLPCFLRVAFAPSEAAAILLDDGHAENAVALLRAHGALAEAGAFWQALAGEPAAAESARARLAQWDAWLERAETEPPPARSAGLPLAVWQDFARIRLTALNETVSLRPDQTEDNPAPTQSLSAQILPVVGATQRISLRADSPHVSGPVWLEGGDGAKLGPVEFQSNPKAHSSAGIFESTAFPRQVRFSLDSKAPEPVGVGQIEFSWTWRDMLAVRAGQLRRALEAPSAPAPAAARRYGDWLALQEVRRADGHVDLTFAALQDFVPPLAVQLHVFQRRKWRPLDVPAPLGAPGAVWRRGELRTVRRPLADDVAPEHVGFAVRTDVQWHSALVPLAAGPENRPFPTLAELIARP